MGFIENLGMQLGGQVLGAGLGMALEGHNDNRQLEQNQKLLDQQRKSNEKMTDYSYSKQLEMWKNTSYAAQREQMEKAGINPALMYGMGGGGGVTTGSGTASVGAAEAPKGGGEAMGLIAQSNLAMTQAQIELLKAQTENVKADTPNKPKTGANIDANTVLTNTNNRIAKLTEDFKGGTLEQNIQKANWELENERQEWLKNNRDNQIGESTQEAEIVKRKAESIGALINNSAKEAGIAVDKATINKITNDIEIGWSQIDINSRNATTAEGRLALDKMIKDVTDSTKLTVDTVTKIFTGILAAATKTPHANVTKTTNVENYY